MEMTPIHTAEIVEIFSSLQGEGIFAGERMTFVRLVRCNLKCQYCDTPQGLCHQEFCQVETPPGSGNFAEMRNPVSAARLSETLASFDDRFLSITGGEPLEQVEFLREWLPSQRPARKIMLETNGVQHERVAQILPQIDVVSMDIKLPSSTGEVPRWGDHTAFLRAVVASGTDVYVKIVVTAATTDQDIEESIRILTSINRYIPLVIQPASPTLKFHRPIEPDHLESLKRLCSAYLTDVRIVPQMHKQWGVL